MWKVIASMDTLVLMVESATGATTVDSGSFLEVVMRGCRCNQAFVMDGIMTMAAFVDTRSRDRLS